MSWWAGARRSTCGPPAMGACWARTFGWCRWTWTSRPLAGTARSRWGSWGTSPPRRRPPPSGCAHKRIDAAILWRDTPYDDTGTTAKIDPRTLSIVLDDLIPTDRVVGVDSGNFMGYPSMYLRVPDENSFAFTQAFQSIGLGLATGIGTALA